MGGPRNSCKEHVARGERLPVLSTTASGSARSSGSTRGWRVAATDVIMGWCQIADLDRGCPGCEPT
jgi:hypothetical protein